MEGSDQGSRDVRGEALLDLLARGTELTRQLVEETADLRRRLVEEHTDPAAARLVETPEEQLALREWLARIEELRSENRSLLERLRSAEDSNLRWAERHAEIEERHNDLANLYVASYQLHATFDPDEVVAAISEIVINLVGAEVFALYACSPDGAQLAPVACEGRPLAAFPVVAVHDGVIGESVASGTVYVAPEERPSGGAPDVDEPVVVVPLRCRSGTLGAVAIYKLFDQKAGLSELDHQLFGLLSSHAAAALMCARLHPSSSTAEHGS